MKRFRDRVDPSGTNEVLRRTKSFGTGDEARLWAEDVASKAESTGKVDIPLNVQMQLLGVASQLKAAGGDPIAILTEANKIERLDIDSLKALTEGAAIVELAEDHLEDKLGDWIEAFSKDPKEKRKVTHFKTISALRSTYEGLSEIKLKSFANASQAIATLTPVLQRYVERDNVKRIQSLKTLRARLRQLLKYTQRKTRIPENSVLEHVSVLDNYTDLDYRLEDPKEDYALSAAEILILIKHFSTTEHFNPTYPIVSALMGTRFSLYQDLKWDMFGGKGRRGDTTINIPKRLLKTVKQKKSNRGIRFKVEAVPNLEVWLWWCLYLEEKLGVKRDKRLPIDSLRTMSEKRLQQSRKQCVKDWEDFFEATVDDEDDFIWSTALLNGFRNSFMTYGLKHPVVSRNCSKIANDWKSHSHYEDLGNAEPELEGRVLFEMNPTFLSLVDMEDKTVDTDFLYADNKERLAIIEKMKDNGNPKALEYECIMESLYLRSENRELYVDPSINEEEILKEILSESPLEMNRKFFANVIKNKTFWMAWYEEIYSDRGF